MEATGFAALRFAIRHACPARLHGLRSAAGTEADNGGAPCAVKEALYECGKIELDIL